MLRSVPPRSHWTRARPCPTPPGGQKRTPLSREPLWIHSPHGFSPGRTHVSTATLWIFDCVEGISSGPVIRAAADVSPSFCRKSRIPCAVRSPAGKSKGRPGTYNHGGGRDAWPGRDDPPPLAITHPRQVRRGIARVRRGEVRGDRILVHLILHTPRHNGKLQESFIEGQRFDDPHLERANPPGLLG